MRQLFVGASELMDSLLQEFAPEQLEAARVLVRQQDHDLGFSPILVGDETRGLFLRRTKDEPPFDIVNQHGALATDDPPAFDSCCDFFTKSWSGDTKLIYVAFSDDDLAVLRMLNMPCTPAAGLAEMNGQQVRRLCGDSHNVQYNTPTSVRTAAVTSGKFRLTLVGWHLAKLVNQRPAGMTPVVSRLLKAEDAFGLDTSKRVDVWQPTTSEFGRISSAVEFADRALARKLIWKSARCSTYSVKDHRARNSARNSTDYRVARRELLRTITRSRELGCQSSEVATRLEAFNRSFDKDVVDAIIGDAMSAADSVERSLLLAAADLMGHWHKSSVLVRSMQKGAVGRFPSQEKVLSPEELKERLRVVDGLVKIHRELTRGK